MIERRSPSGISTVRIIAVVVMACIVLAGMVAEHVSRPAAEGPPLKAEQTEQAERDARDLLRELLAGEIDAETFSRELDEVSVHPGFLVFGTLWGAAFIAGAAALLVLGVLLLCRVRLRPRGNWAPGAPWQPLDGIEAILFFACSQLVVGGLVAVIWQGGRPTVEGMRPGSLAVGYVLSAAATVALLSRRTAGGLPRLWSTVWARLRPVALRLLQGAGGYIVALPLLVAAGWINPFGRDALSANPVVSVLAGEHSVLAWIVLFVVIGLCAPVFEEFVFRACAYPAFRRRWGVALAIVANGLLFGAIHGQLPLLVPLTVLGIVFATLYELTGSLLPCIIAHSAQNTLTLVYVMWLTA